MGTTLNKLEYLDTTKSQIKTALNQFNAGITDNDTFRSYVNKINNIYDNWEKVTGEGTSITLTPTKKGKLDFEDGIVGYGQSSQESRQGYNLLQAKLPTMTNSGITITNNNDGTFTISGTNTSSSITTFRLDQSTQNGTDNLQNYENGTWTIDKGTTSENIGITLMQNGTWTALLGTGFNAKVNSQAITGATNTFIYIGIKANASFSTPVTIKPMLVKGSYTESTIPSFEQYGVSPSPSYPQDIEVVRGKNRFDKDNANIINSYFLQTDPTISATGNLYRTIYLECEPNTTYTISKTLSARFSVGYTSVIPTVGTSVSGVITNNTATSITITTGSNAKYLIAFIYHSSYDTLTPQQIYDTIQIEKGSQATSYLPYNTIEVVERGKNECESFVGVDTDVAYRGVLRCEFDIKPNTQYAISFKGTNGCKLYTNETLFTNSQYFTIDTSRITLVATTKSTIPNDQHTTDGWLILKNQNGTPSGCTFSEVQIEKNSQATPYEPYQTPQTYQLSLGEYEFAKIGNYVDTIEYDVENDKVYKKEKIGKIVLDGSNDENWQTDYNTDYVSNRFTCDNLPSLGVTTQTNFNYGYCNIGAITSEASYTTYLNVIKLRYINNQNRVDCMFDIADVSTLRTLLAQTPMEIYYQKLGGATLTKIPITGTLADQIKALYNSHSFTGTTIIEIDGNLPIIIKVKALKGVSE